MTEPTYNVTLLTGTMELKPIEYRVVSYIDGPWWWRQKLWAIETDFMRWPGFISSREAAQTALLLSGS